MNADVQLTIFEFVTILVAAGAIGALIVLAVAWSSTYRVAHRLMDLLDAFGEEERILRIRLEELDPEGGSR